jgi:signal transduction histidine kinase
MSAPRTLDPVGSVKVKLGLLVAISILVAAIVASLGTRADVSFWLTLPVTVAIALAVTQLLAVGMTSPLREMTAAARRMARGDYGVRVTATSNDEIGQLARAFNRMAEDLAGVDRQRRDLVANVSHELRTPLAALCALLENLADGVATPDPASLRAALDQAERLTALVADLLDLSRVDAGKAPLAVEAVSVADLLSSAIDEARFTGRDVGFLVSVIPEDLQVEADPARLRQLVANLLDNASRHSPSGATVHVTATTTADGWRLEVADEGPGIAPDDRERVFERFGTLADPMLSGGEGTGGGTGLGLAIARWVTDLHGGAIGFVDPAPGSSGARARVNLPSPPSPQPSPTPQEVRMDTPLVTPAPAPALPPLAAEPPNLDTLFGRFWPDDGVPGSVRAVLASALAGLVAGLVLPERHFGLGTTLVLLACGGTILAFSRHRRSAFTRTCAVVCVLLALVPTIRDAEWLTVLSVFAGIATCMAGLAQGRTLPSFVLAGISWPLAALRGLPWLGRSLGALGRLNHGTAILRTAVWSVLGLVVFGLLFASADALFAEWMSALVPDLRVDTVVPHLFVACAVGGVTLAAAYLAINPPNLDRPGATPRPVAHRFEWLAPVLLVDAVFVLFLIAQATVVFGGHDYLQRTTGLTYAEYVHQGFGQLTVATVLTLLVVWAAARKAPRATATDRAWIRASLGLLCAATLVVVASALYRMHLYQEAYGFTRLRLLVDLFEGWLGFLVLAVAAAGISLRAAWLPRTALLTGAGLVLGLALLNPDAWIARHNLDRYAETGKVDWVYLQGLSDDAVPVLAELPDPERSCAIGEAGHNPAGHDWLEWNLGWHRAEPLLAQGSRLPVVPDCSRDTAGRVVPFPAP